MGSGGGGGATAVLLLLVLTSTSDGGVEGGVDGVQQKDKREAASSSRNKACELLVAVDEPLFAQRQRSIENVTRLVASLVDGLNTIYARTFFVGRFASYYFRVKNIHVLHDFCGECNQTQQGFLQRFTTYADTEEYCLAVIFTHRDFPSGVQGLAWRNTVCESRFNTGFITFLNHQQEANEKDMVMTLAHEIGHNFGAQHDEDTQCAPQGNNFIMAESGSNDKDLQFSPCSLHDMNTRMEEVIDPSNNKHFDTCFTDKEQDASRPSFCGNSVVEYGEECDCGLDYRTCPDPCCYAGRPDPADLLPVLGRDSHDYKPCHKMALARCTRPWATALQFGLIVPCLFILVAALLLSVVLHLDWQRDRTLYVHVTRPAGLIRSETSDQVAGREKREKKKKAFVIETCRNGGLADADGKFVIRLSQPSHGGSRKSEGGEELAAVRLRDSTAAAGSHSRSAPVHRSSPAVGRIQPVRQAPSVPPSFAPPAPPASSSAPLMPPTEGAEGVVGAGHVRLMIKEKFMDKMGVSKYK